LEPGLFVAVVRFTDSLIMRRQRGAEGGP